MADEATVETVYWETVSMPPLSLDLYLEEGLELPPVFQNHILASLKALWPVYFNLACQEKIPQNLGLACAEQVWEVELTWLSNPGIQQLNRQYRGKDQPTDVLSFPLLTSVTAQLPEVSLGSIFVSWQWAQEAVCKEGNFLPDVVFHVKEPLLRYMMERVIHGWLHLMGVNHDTMEEYNKVVTIQRQVLDEGLSSLTVE